jgi:hypothetical protein
VDSIAIRAGQSPGERAWRSVVSLSPNGLQRIGRHLKDFSMTVRVLLYENKYVKRGGNWESSNWTLASILMSVPFLLLRISPHFLYHTHLHAFLSWRIVSRDRRRFAGDAT